MAFAGRRWEIDHLQRVLSEPGALVEVVGPGGVGKSSLLREVASDRERFPGGVKWIQGRVPGALGELLNGLQYNNVEAHQLVVIDEAESIARAELLGALRRLLAERLPIAVAVLGRAIHELGGHRLVLKGLPPAEARDFLESMGVRMDDTLIEQLTREGGALPVVLELLVRRTAARPERPEEFGRLFEPYSAAGLVDLAGRPLSQRSSAGRRIITDVREINDDLLRRAADDEDFVFRITPRRFEELVAELLTRRGYDVELTPASRDGGIDMYAARRDDLGTFRYVVECKRYAPKRPVGVEIVRQLHGVANLGRANGAIVVTTSHFTSGARSFAGELRQLMSLKDYFDLRGWLESSRPDP